MKTLLIDNYDSFSHILFQYLWEVNGEEPLFIGNDAWSLDAIRAARFDNILLSPGPGRPDNARDFGICAEVIRAFTGVPMLGVCLGHQGLGLAAGARIVSAPRVRHGKYSRILHDGEGLFAGLPQGFRAVRYHSLVIDGAERPPGLLVTATAEDDGQIMAITMANRPGYGVQFHPESMGTEEGKTLLANFRDLTRKWRHETGKPDRVAAAPAVLSPLRREGTATKKMVTLELPWKDPETVFGKWFRDCPAAFWLDSQTAAVPGARAITYMGTGSRLFEARGTRLRVLGLDESGKTFLPLEAREGDPFAFLREQLGLRTAVTGKSGDFTGEFKGGWVGYFGYGLKRFAGSGNLQDTQADSPPDAFFLEPDRMLAFDHETGKVHAFAARGAGASPGAGPWLDGLGILWSALAEAPDLPLRRVGPDPMSLDAFRLPWSLSASRETYLERIRALQSAIRRGESYEACLTNEIRTRSDADPFLVYRLLRRTNPAPYAAYLKFPQGEVLSASPERFLKLDAAGRLQSRPIKGTRRRGATPDEDKALREDLRNCEKDHSENLMIVDLMRNDFGKVCETGSIGVPEFMSVEEHPTVFQLVSGVEGKLAPGYSALDAVRACFPGGSMTGAPKLRAMELLEALERRPRGVFSGALGYLGCDGAMDLGMVIRTLIHWNGEYRVGCGGAILDESDPGAEYEEALLKAYAPARALELAALGECGGWKLA